MDTIDLLQRYLGQPLKEGTFFDSAERVPLAGVVPEHWRAAVVRVMTVPGPRTPQGEAAAAAA